MQQFKLSLKCQLALCSVLCAIGLTACEDSTIVWSPDGNRMAFIGHGLYFGDQNGKISTTVATLAKKVAWLPDSKSVLLGETTDVSSWDEAKKYLTDAEQKQVIELSQYIERKLELGGMAALDHDGRTDSAPPNVLQCAFLYLKDTDGRHIKTVLGEMGPLVDLWKTELHSLTVLKAEENALGKEIWQGFGDVIDARVSPDGKFLLLVQKSQTKIEPELFDLKLLALDTNSPPMLLTEAAAKHPDWSPDSRKVIYIEGLGVNEEKSRLGALSSLVVRENDGTPIKTPGKSQRLLYLAIDEDMDLHSLKEGRIIFSSPCPQLPATSDELTALRNVFTFREGDSFARKLLAVTDTTGGKEVSPIQVNTDQTWAILGDGEWLRILNIETGKVEIIHIKDDIQPTWRNADDLCYAKPIEKDKIQKNRHDVEIVLHSMTTGKERIISADWPAGAVDEILIHKKKAK